MQLVFDLFINLNENSRVLSSYCRLNFQLLFNMEEFFPNAVKAIKQTLLVTNKTYQRVLVLNNLLGFQVGLNRGRVFVPLKDLYFLH